MAGLLRRTLIGAAVATLALTLGAARADAAATPDAMTPLGAGSRLVNADGDTVNKCLDGRYTRAFMFQCNGAAYQQWNLYGSKLVNSEFGECLADFGDGQGQPVTMVQADRCGPTSRVLWTRTWYGNWFQFRNVETGRCLDVRDYGTSSVVQTWPCLNQGNQKWKWVT
jgi:hypothetical protein